MMIGRAGLEMAS